MNAPIRKINVIIFILLCTGLHRAWSQSALAEKKDTTRILISNLDVQFETTEALNSLYNFKFDEAEKQFRWLKKKYSWHPLPYFLLGLNEWWKIMPNVKNTSHDKRFIAYMDTAIVVAKKLYKKSPSDKTEASFFLAASYGFIGRLYSEEERSQWGKAAVAGGRALHYLDESKETKYLNPELLFGDALYNYFSVWIRENYPSLKIILWLFPKGDKALGLKQLEQVSYNAFYTRTEAMVWLMRIFSGYENKHEDALRLAKYLHQIYPDNPYFHRYYAKTLYVLNKVDELEKQAKEILHRIGISMVGYEYNSGRYAAYYLAFVYQVRGDEVEKKKYYLLTENYSEKVGTLDSWYYISALMNLGDIYHHQKEYDKAIYYYAKVKKVSERRGNLRKDAVKKLKALKKQKIYN